MTTLVCPKCQSDMRSYERNGVTIEQCTDCRGLFLDRGELDRLIAAENAWEGTAQQGVPQPGVPQPGSPRSGSTGYEPTRRYDDDDDDDRRRYDQYGRPGRKKSFLSELFD